MESNPEKVDFVKGMEASVKFFDAASKCLHVITATQRHLAVFPLTEDVENAGRVRFYTIRAGYASNHPQTARRGTG